MEDKEKDKLSGFKDIEEFLRFINQFYPDLIIEESTIEMIENSLLDFLIKLVGKIISISPENMRLFLKDYLLKYEILNIKQIILGTFLGFTKQEKKKFVNYLVEDILENTEFINKLLNFSNLDELQFFFKGTRYYKQIREGLLYYRNNGEVFVLEAFLDQLYYQNLMRKAGVYSKEEKKLLSLYTSMVIELYNLNLIYRGIINKIDTGLLSQFIVLDFYLLNERKLNFLLDSSNTEDFFNKLYQFLARPNNPINLLSAEHPLWVLEKYYTQNLLNKLRRYKGNITENTISRILEILIKKIEEINIEILPNVVRILHEKFEKLKRSI